ncbi:MAG: hypothetical protein JWO31_3087 [Phycisphaerales bacterium]|nr:hypothetical protein [Phycisphaerales bacterium]
MLRGERGRWGMLLLVLAAGLTASAARQRSAAQGTELRTLLAREAEIKVRAAAVHAAYAESIARWAMASEGDPPPVLTLRVEDVLALERIQLRLVELRGGGDGLAAE